MHSDWQCERHGSVLPLRVMPRLGADVLAKAVAAAKVPLWAPVPLIPGWTATGLSVAGDERTGWRATAFAMSGPCPVGGPADMVLVAEEPGVGLGARYAGRTDTDPGEVLSGPPEAKVEAAGHPTALWRCASAPDRVAFVGEALGVWLWAVLWPPTAELVLLEEVVLHDLRHEAHAGLDLPLGAPSTRLSEPLPD
jgi:hypothetical protein